MIVNNLYSEIYVIVTIMINYFPLFSNRFSTVEQANYVVINESILIVPCSSPYESLLDALPFSSSLFAFASDGVDLPQAESNATVIVRRKRYDTGLILLLNMMAP